MENCDKILNRILQAKEQRSIIKERIKNKNFASISYSLNIPGFPKTSENIKQFFSLALNQLKLFLKANLIEIADESESIDDAGHYFAASLNHPDSDIQHIKQLCESFEEEHPLGRLIDIDVTDSAGNYISSGKNKLCIFCGSYSALECMHSKRHSYEELRGFISEEINKYLLIRGKKKVCNVLASCAARAILYEISVSPKPGLVDFYGPGIHKDMDYFSFINSSSAIIPYYFQIAEKGFMFDKPLSAALPAIRESGLEMEKEMFAATKGVNTQKGIIFLLGVAVFASAKLIAENDSFDLNLFSEMTKIICKDVLKEFDNKQAAVTHGKKCFSKYGTNAGGARLEVAGGFTTAINFGLSVLDKYDLEKLDFSEKQKILSSALLHLIANNNDTNVIYRSSPEVLERLKSLSLITFNSQNEKKKQHNYLALEAFCHDNNISPGGSADLLAIALFLYFIKRSV